GAGVGPGDPPALRCARHRAPAPHGDGHAHGPPPGVGARRAGRGPRGGGGVILRDGVFVTGTDTGIGKTVVSAALGLAAQASGHTAVVLKPGQTGDDGTITGDAEFCQMVLGTDEPLDAISPIRLRAPLAPAVAARLEAARVDPDLVRGRHAALRTRYDLVIVEGAGGLLVPFADGVDMAGLAAMLGLPLIVVARPGLGTLNHILLTLEAAHRRGLTVL